MALYNLTDTFIKKDVWVKNIKKTFDPQILAELIKKRIESPGMTGPYVRSNSDEVSTDIIDAFIASDLEYRKKLEPAVGFLIYKINQEGDSVNPPHDLIRGLFNIIKNSRLTECEKLVGEWLEKNHKQLSINNEKWNHTFRCGLMAYAKIQKKNKETEDWWINLWKTGSPFWWEVAFYGLLKQNPDLTIEELPLLVNRNLANNPYLIMGIWKNKTIRHKLEKALYKAIREEAGWGGKALNGLCSKLAENERNMVLFSLRSLFMQA